MVVFDVTDVFTNFCNLLTTLQIFKCRAVRGMDPAGNLRSDIQRALEHRRLTQWQRKFLTDIHARLERSDGQARLSDKQWRMVFEILGPQTDAKAPSASPNRQPRPLRTAPLMPRFRPRRRYFSRRIERLVFGFAIVAVVAAFQILTGTGTWEKQSRPAPAAIGQPVAQGFTVTDGDTVRVLGEATGTRLVGFNTPEKFSPQCASERQLGERASARLTELVGGGAIRLTKVACACAPGTEGTERCNHGRSCGTLLVDGEDVGNILIREGLAVPFVCSDTRCPPTRARGVRLAIHSVCLTHFRAPAMFIRWTTYTRLMFPKTIRNAFCDARKRFILLSRASSIGRLLPAGGQTRW